MAIFVSGGHLSMNIEDNVQKSHCDVIAYVIKIKNVFSGLISDDLSISAVKINPSQIFRNFQNGRHFQVWQAF